MVNKMHLLTEVKKAEGGKKGEVLIYSHIVDYKWDENDVTSTDFNKQLAELGDVDEITVRINSQGGIVSEAIAIRTALLKHKATKTVDIEGCCASAATLIACMPNVKVRMAEGAEYMIHNCSSFAMGQKDKILSAYNSMKKTDKTMAEIYAKRTGKTEEECAKLMQAETWFTAEEAKAEGFVDEILTGEEDGVEIAAYAVTADMLEAMKEAYINLPEKFSATVSEFETAPLSGKILPEDEGQGDHADDGKYPVKDPDQTMETEPEGTAEEPGAGDAAHNPVSREASVVAAESSTENISDGGMTMELKNATTEQLRAENPALVQSIAEEAVKAERSRVAEITALTREGEKWQEMAKKAIEEGTSAADYLKTIIAEEKAQREGYLATRREELKAASNVGGGDTKDNDKDDPEAKADAAAKEIAEIAKTMNASGIEMA